MGCNRQTILKETRKYHLHTYIKYYQTMTCILSYDKTIKKREKILETEFEGQITIANQQFAVIC